MRHMRLAITTAHTAHSHAHTHQRHTMPPTKCDAHTSRAMCSANAALLHRQLADEYGCAHAPGEVSFIERLINRGSNQPESGSRNRVDDDAAPEYTLSAPLLRLYQPQHLAAFSSRCAEHESLMHQSSAFGSKFDHSYPELAGLIQFATRAIQRIIAFVAQRHAFIDIETKDVTMPPTAAAPSEATNATQQTGAKDGCSVGSLTSTPTVAVSEAFYFVITSPACKLIGVDGAFGGCFTSSC